MRTKSNLAWEACRDWYSFIGLFLITSTVLMGCGSFSGDSAVSKQAKGNKAVNFTFSDATKRSGLGSFRHVSGAFGDRWFPEAMGAGCGFLDYNGDGWLDIVLVAGGTWQQSKGKAPPALQLYRNNTDGTFTDVTGQAGLGGVRAYAFGVTAADYDNDGDQDLYLTGLYHNRLFRNDDNVFTDVTKTAGVGGAKEWSTSAIFFDANQDGHLDLYVGSYVEWSPDEDLVCTVDGSIRSYCTPLVYDGIPGRYYQNQGDGTFTDRTDEAGFAGSPGKTLGVASLDYNKDGWPDLVVANDTERNLLYKNNGDGTFTERGRRSGIAYDENGSARAGMGIDIGVIDNSGEPTIFVGNFSKEMVGMFQHVGDGLFKDLAASSQVGQETLMTLTFGLFLFDVDLDGDSDVFAANGHVQPEIGEATGRITYREAPHLFLNGPTDSFKDVARTVGGVLTQKLVARGAAYGDYDRDGDLDVLVTENEGPAHLWRNQLMESSESAPHYLRVHLEGAESNRDGIGARVVAVTNDQRMERRVRTGSSFLAQLEKTVTFGLGKASSVDSLRIYWPSGQVDRISNVAAGQTLYVREGAAKADEPLAQRTE